MAIVYILTNESMSDIIKIGITDNLSRRLRELDNTSTPLPFECFYAVEVDDAAAIERKMHQGLDECRVRQNREYFYTTPERAKSLLEIAEVMGGKNVTPTEDILDSDQDKQALENARKIRGKFNFQMFDLQVGTELYFKKDNSIKCEIFDDNQVKFRGKVTSLSNAAFIAIQELGYDWNAISGPAFWCYEGKSLYDMRKEIDS